MDMEFPSLTLKSVWPTTRRATVPVTGQYCLSATMPIWRVRTVLFTFPFILILRCEKQRLGLCNYCFKGLQLRRIDAVQPNDELVPSIQPTPIR